MTGAEFQENLKLLGWSQAAFARRIEVDPGTVSRWIKSDSVPKVVADHINTMLILKGVVDGR